jgi:hypothetical protein
LCPVCCSWKTEHQWHGKQCRDCYNELHPPHPSSSTAASTPSSPPSPPPPLFESHNGRNSPLSPIQRAAIVILHKKEELNKEIAAEVGTSLPTVHHWIKHYDQHLDIGNESREGRPRITDTTVDKMIVDEAKEIKFTSPRQLKRKLELTNISTRTIDRRLIRRNIFESDYHLLKDIRIGQKSNGRMLYLVMKKYSHVDSMVKFGYEDL